MTGWYTWLHHDVPIEWTNDLDARLRYIEKDKPVHERVIRLAAIVAVPEARVPREYVEAWRAYIDAWRVTQDQLLAARPRVRA